ncbi:MAG: serine hydrolase [Caldilineaceae bacterium]
MNGFTKFVLTLILILSVFPLYTRYKASAAPIPPGVHLGGVEMGRVKDVAEAAALLDARNTEPVAVFYGDRRLILRPEDVEYQVDVTRMISDATRYLDGPDFVDISLRHLLGLEQKRRDVPVYATVNAQKLTAWLTAAAAANDRPPQPARAIPPRWQWAAEDNTPDASVGFVGAVRDEWQWSQGAPGQKLLVEASIQPVLDALGSSDRREAHLVLDETPAGPPSLDDLAAVLNSFTSDFPGFAAIYVQDLMSGEEGTVDVDVAFSGMSTMKVAIVTALFSQLELAPGEHAEFDTVVGQLIDYALGESNNVAANGLLGQIGYGDVYAGARRVTEFLHGLGYVNSFIQTGYDDKSSISQIPTAANQRTDWNTEPDTHLQSTPGEMGRLLADIYYCTQGEGKLLSVYPGDLTPEECKTILFYMSHDEFAELLWGGVPRPEDTWLVHKHGFVNDAHSDLALIWGPAGPYVLSVYLYRQGWMDWETSNSAMKEISRIVWSFFAFRQTLQQTPPPEPLVLEPPANYLPVLDSYFGQAANSGTPSVP